LFLTRFSSRTYSTRVAPRPNSLSQFPRCAQANSLPSAGDAKFRAGPLATTRSALVVSATNPIAAQPIFSFCSRLVTLLRGVPAAAAVTGSHFPRVDGLLRLC
jgi:hypothetical protein